MIITLSSKSRINIFSSKKIILVILSLSLPLTIQGQKILKIIKNKKLKLIYFEAGEAGTSKQVKHEMVAIFNTEKNKFNEKTYITKFIGLGPEAQPKFEIKEGKIIYSLPQN